MRKSKYFKVVTAFALTAVLGVQPLTSVMASEVDNTEVVTGENVEETQKTKETNAATGGFVAVEDRVPGVVSDSSDIKSFTAGASSTYYKTPNLPEVKDQNPYGTCWAFSTLACAEINLMKKGYTDVDLSELHLAYFAYNFVNDPLGGLTGDDHYFDGSSFLVEGGNYQFSANALADWRGAANESVAPYDYDTTDYVEQNGLPDSVAYNASYHLENFFYLANNVTDIKNAIVDYGAVAVNYYAYGDNYNNKYYNSQTYGYYCYDSSIANHAVTIVGWDDNYSATNFPTQPEGDGAWIVRNSWGTGYGNNGYFYLSYYDASIDSLLAVYDFAPASNYDNNYQYDGSMWYGDFSFGGEELTVANIFTAKACENGEKLAAVSFEIGSVNSAYTVSIYTDLTDKGNPYSGKLATTQTGTTTYEGQYTVKLNTPVSLEKGTNYAVVVTIQDEDEGATIICDYSYNAYGWFSTTSTANQNESFYYYGGAWRDYGAQSDRNFRIKAFTNNIDVNNLAQAEDGNWYYYVNGKVDTTHTGLVQNAYGWWYVQNGQVTFKYTGLVQNAYGWWYVKNSKVMFNHTGLVQNSYGWWYVKNGKVDFTYSGVVSNAYGTWYVKNGKADLTKNGLQTPDGTNWYCFANGKVLKDYTGIVQNAGGFWYVQKGQVTFKYTGLAPNKYGWWYVKNSKVDLTYTGTYTWNGKTYSIIKGKVQL